MRQLTNIQEIETAVNEYGDIVISKNNKNNVIVMTMSEYRKKLIEDEIEKKLLASEEDYKNGNIRNAEDVFKEWETRYGI